MELIIVIDKNSSALKEMEKSLHGHRYRLVLTDDYQKGIKYTKSGSPDIIFFGLYERYRESLQAMIELKKDPISKNIPLIAIMEKQDQSLVSQSHRFGVTDNLFLPAEPDEIIDKINKILELDRSQKENQASSRKTHIEVEQPNSERTMISFKSGLKKYVLPEVRSVFNVEFLNMIKDDEISIDLRDIPYLEVDELKILNRMVALFRDKTIAIIAGRHLGLILSESELEEKVNLFMSLEEYETFLEVQNSSGYR